MCVRLEPLHGYFRGKDKQSYIHLQCEQIPSRLLQLVMSVIHSSVKIWFPRALILACRQKEQCLYFLWNQWFIVFTAHMKPSPLVSCKDGSTPFTFTSKSFLFLSFLRGLSFSHLKLITFLPHFQTTLPLLFRLPAHLSPAPFILFWEYS